jgi:AraC family transcriptional activator of pobA
VERLEQRLSPKVPFPHRHDFYHLVLLEKGSGWHEIDFVKYRVKAAQLFLVRPGQVHSWQLGAGTRGLVLEFTRQSLAATAGGVLDNLSAPALIEAKDALSIREIMLPMFDEFSAKKRNFRLCLEHLLISLLLRLGRNRSEKQETKSDSLLEKFRALLDLHFSKQHGVDFYANLLKVSPKKLTTQAVKHLKKPAGTLIQERCLVEAKRLLAFSELSVAEIAFAVGYQDANYFARLFRQKVGLTPGRFRRLAQHSVH